MLKPKQAAKTVEVGDHKMVSLWPSHLQSLLITSADSSPSGALFRDVLCFVGSKRDQENQRTSESLALINGVIGSGDK